jgi:H+/gluconate symporter-like permease
VRSQTEFGNEGNSPVDPLATTIGALIAAVLIALAAYFGWRQCATWRTVRADAKLPADQRRFLLKQFQRRLFGSILLLLLAGMMIGALFLDFDPRGDDEAVKKMVRFLGAYVIAMLLVIMGMLVIAIVDFWATARFSFQQQKQLIQEHHEKLEADLWELQHRISEPEA